MTPGQVAAQLVVLLGVVHGIGIGAPLGVLVWRRKLPALIALLGRR